MEQYTINELLSLVSAVRARKSSLVSLRDKVSTRETYFGREEKVVEPQYDVKKLDKKITELENFLFKADSSIKQKNAEVKIDIDAGAGLLLSPIE